MKKNTLLTVASILGASLSVDAMATISPYVSVRVGGSHLSTRGSLNKGSKTGLSYQAAVGANYDITDTWMTGFEVYGGTDPFDVTVKETASGSHNLKKNRLKAYFGAMGRVGYRIGQALPYLLVGVERATVKQKLEQTNIAGGQTAPYSKTRSATYPVFGVGVETKVADNIAIDVRFTHGQTKVRSISGTSKNPWKVQRLLAGLTYTF